MSFFIARYFNDFLDLFYPENCEACTEPLVGNEKVICTKCQLNLPRTNSHRIEIPSLANKFAGKVFIKDVFSFLKFEKQGKVQRLLHGLKYGNKPEIGYTLGKLYGQELLETGVVYDLIIPVPLHSRKLSQRGYNQSDKIAEGLAEGLKTDWSAEVLMRQKFTESQTGKGRVERFENVSGIFKILDATKIQNKHIAVVDDIMTTGSTIESAVAELLQNGAKEVSVLTIATTF